MSFLQVGSIVVTATDVQHEIEEIGGRERMFDASLASSIRAVKNRWTVTTQPFDRAYADSIVAILVGAQPVTCSGDLLGSSLQCGTQFLGFVPERTASGTKYRVRFTLHQV